MKSARILRHNKIPRIKLNGEYATKAALCGWHFSICIVRKSLAQQKKRVNYVIPTFMRERKKIWRRKINVKCIAIECGKAATALLCDQMTAIKRLQLLRSMRACVIHNLHVQSMRETKYDLVHNANYSLLKYT